MFHTTFRSRIVSTCGACGEGVDVEDGVDYVEDAAAVARLIMASSDGQEVVAVAGPSPLPC